MFHWFLGLDLHSVGGVMVSMVAFQAVDPGSIPGRRKFFVKIFFRIGENVSADTITF